MWLGLEGLGLLFCGGFTFSPGVCALVRGWVGAGGVGATLRSWFHSSWGCQSLSWSWFHSFKTWAGMCVLEMLPQPWWEAGSGQGQLHSLWVRTLSSAMAASTLVESSTGATGPGPGLECTLRQSWLAGQSPRQFSIRCLCTVTRSKHICTSALQERSLDFLQPSNKLHWFSNQEGSSSWC